MMFQEDKLRSLMDGVVKDGEIINRIVNRIGERYTQDLDKFMISVEAILKGEREITDVELEEIILKIPAYLYFAVQGLETLGVESDVAKAAKAEIFAEIFLKADGTIPDKTKIAERHTQEEQIIEIAFARAYKKLKTMVDKAELLFSGANKIYQKRVTEMNIKSREKFYNQKVGGLG